MTPDTVIQCTSSVGIAIINTTNLTIKNMIIKNCKNAYHSQKSAIFINECYFIKLHSESIYHARSVISLLEINILGNSYLNEIACHEMHFYYIETIVKAKNSKHNILINRYYTINHFINEYGIHVNMSQYSYEITLQVINTTIQLLKLFVFYMQFPAV